MRYVNIQVRPVLWAQKGRSSPADLWNEDKRGNRKEERTNNNVTAEIQGYAKEWKTQEISSGGPAKENDWTVMAMQTMGMVHEDLGVTALVHVCICTRLFSSTGFWADLSVIIKWSLKCDLETLKQENNFRHLSSVWKFKILTKTKQNCHLLSRSTVVLH